MGSKTGISWTDATHNFWYGCEKVSPGCKLCYAERDMTRYGRDFRAVTRAKGFDKPLSWKEPRKVFVNSWSDFFIEQADAWRDDAWDVIRRTPHLTYQILTKRPERIAAHLPSDWGSGWPNVWLGVSAENQEYADERIPLLLQTPAAVRFVSYEPALGPVSFGQWTDEGLECSECSWRGVEEDAIRIDDPNDDDSHYDCPKCREICAHTPIDECLGEGIRWIICGGESGPAARPMDLDWVRSVRDQCQSAGVAFFFKQAKINGRIVELPLLDGRSYAEFPCHK